MTKRCPVPSEDLSSRRQYSTRRLLLPSVIIIPSLIITGIYSANFLANQVSSCHWSLVRGWSLISLNRCLAQFFDQDLMQLLSQNCAVNANTFKRLTTRISLSKAPVASYQQCQLFCQNVAASNTRVLFEKAAKQLQNTTAPACYSASLMCADWSIFFAVIALFAGLVKFGLFVKTILSPQPFVKMDGNYSATSGLTSNKAEKPSDSLENVDRFLSNEPLLAAVSDMEYSSFDSNI